MKIHNIHRIMSPKKEKEMSCETCSPKEGCRVEAVLTIDDRGQMVLPKDVREKASISSGDKLALISWTRDGSVCCLALMKAENLSGMVKDILGPLLHEDTK
jgi:AbrB family looped-hinge helix DNA binding protein